MRRKYLTLGALLVAGSLMWSNTLQAQGDNCAGAVAVSPGAHVADGPSAGAGNSTLCSTGGTNADWYSFTTATGGILNNINSCNGGADTRVSVFNGNGGCGALACLGFNDDFCDQGDGNFFASQLTNINLPAGTHYFEWDDRWDPSGFTWNFTFTPFACVQPAATVTLVPNCGGGTYDLQVNITSLGSATSVNLDISTGTDITGITTTGIQTFTGIPVGATRSITLVHNQDNTCNVALGSFIDCCSASCADAVVVTSLGAQPATGTLYCSSGYNGACAAGPFASKWYVYTPPSDGLLSVKACPAGDTRLSLFDGTGGCGALTCLASNDDDNDLACQASGFASSVTDVPVTGGTAYYIQWDARWSTASVANWTVNFAACTPPAGTVTLVENCGGGTYDLQVNISSLGSSTDIDIDVTPGTDILNINTPGLYVVTAPIGTVTNVTLRADDPLCDVDLGNFTDCCNGTCANAAAAVVGTNTTGALNCGAGASNAGGMGGTAIDARWFTFTPPSTGQISVNNCGSGVDSRVSIFTGPCGGQALVAANDDDNIGTCGFSLESTVANVPVNGGTTYYIEWDDRWSSTGFDWVLSYVSCTPPTASGSSLDNCGAGTFTIDVDVTSLGSSAELQIESDLNGIEVASVTATGIVAIPTVYTAGTPVTITLRSTSDANCSLVVGTFGDCCSGSCIGAVPASIGTNTNLPIDCGGGATNALAGGAVNARWWTWTPASNGLAVVSACNPPNTTNFDTRVTVHTGTCGSLTLVGGDDDGCTNPGFGSTFGWLANAGTTYYIEWDDRWDGTGHDWDLSLTPCVAPANDECSGEIPTLNPLNIGGSINYAGDANCANDELGIANIFGVSGYVWASFELLACADVVVDYCGTFDFTTGALNMYTDCSGTNPVNSQSFNFTTCGDGNPSIFYNSLNPGVYYYPVLWAVNFPSSTYNINISANAPDVPCTPNICSVALPISCGGAVSGTTVSNTATQGPSVCLPNHTAPGADAWYYVDALTTEVYTASTCLGTSYNSMITVYDGGASPGNCGALVCLTGNDDNCGAGTNTPSEVNFAAVAGNRYYIAVHGPSGFVNSTGAFTLNLTCAPATCPAPVNDECAGSVAVVPVLGDGSGTPTTYDNCGAFADANPSCDVDLSFVPAAGRAQGIWFTFNTGLNEYMNVTLLNDDLGPYTATSLSYALYSGTCGALVEVDCNNTAEGTNAFPQLTQNTDYYLLVHNPGGVGTEGTFGLLLEFPAQNDAAVTAVVAPSGNLCTTTVAPQITVLNNGQQPLTSLTVTYDVDGGAPVVTNLTFAPALTYGQSQNVNLTSSITTGGPHTLNVVSSNPNGVPDEITSNDSNSGAFTVDGEAVQIVMVQDRWGSETTWEVYDALEIAPIASGGPYTDLGANGTADQVHNLCLPLTFGNCFTLRVIDAFGDGMCCLYGNGNWQVRSPNGALLISDVFQGSGTLAGSSDNGGSTSPNANNPTYTGHEFCLPKGPSDIESGECNVFNNTMNNKVYTTAAPGTGNYMFEFLNPDFGYRRRINVPQRYVKFSQLQTQPLVAGTHYFVRARRDAANDGFFNDNWGSGCNMALDPTQVPGCAQLINDVDLPTHSCGVTRSFGYSDKVWSTPVLGATQYRFKFTGALDPDGPNGPLGPVNGDRVITQASYVRVLNWASYTLIEGETYNVQVEVLVSGTWSGYCGNVCTVTIDNPAFAGNNLNSTAVNEMGMALYPNPVRDGNVTLTLDGLTGEENVVTVDVFDVFGKRVFTQTIGTEGATAINAVLELGGQLASGMYMVDVTAGEQKFVQRLSIQ